MLYPLVTGHYFFPFMDIEPSRANRFLGDVIPVFHNRDVISVLQNARCIEFGKVYVLWKLYSAVRIQK